MARKTTAAFWKGYAPSVATESSEPPALFNVDEVEALVQGAARAGQALSYSHALLALGYRFTRPKMRALCVVLGAVDDRAAARGEPELAVLVVRESDGLPGQGWWVGRTAQQAGKRKTYSGPWEGPEAAAYIEKLQSKAFRYWKTR
jgi:hypothetical protein